MSARLNIGSDPANVQLVGTQTVAGAAVSGVSFTGLNLGGVVAYRIIGSVINAGTGCPLRVEFNGDAVQTNYHRQMGQIAGTGISCARYNSNEIGGILSTAGNAASLDILFKQMAGRTPIAMSRMDDGVYFDAVVGISIDLNAIYKDATTNVTRIDITSGVADQIDVGSKFSLYKYL